MKILKGVERYTRDDGATMVCIAPGRFINVKEIGKPTFRYPGALRPWESEPVERVTFRVIKEPEPVPLAEAA